ncbi:S41 family peptidase [Bacteroides coprosuis]|uniref:S41 family peptidase n=2 Tax=Bacteroides TaxID=816 RepID=UPI003C6C904D
MHRFSLLLVIALISYPVFSQKKEIPISRKLQMAEFLITKLYVDSVDEGKIVEAAIQGMLNELDPHSTYSNAEEVKLFNESMQGEFFGIGIQFQMMQDTLYVIQPVVKGPSEKVGIQAGDKIISVDKESIAGVGMNTSRIMKLLRGPRKSKVLLEIVRRGVEDTLYFTVERDKIPVETIDASYLLTAQTGYIRLNQFGKNSAKEFETALRHLKNQKIENLVLDLRGNSGGFLDAAIDIANHFLQGKQRIVYAKGNKVDIGSFYAKGNGLFQEGKLIVLVDEFSASASEILAGAIQDWDRGIIVGRRSFGKGLVQRPIDLFDGSMIRLTIARYYTPSGRSIQKPYDKGESNRKNYGEDILHRLERGEHISKDSIQLVDSLKYKTLTLSRTVYGGGGVMPDVFVPVDTTHVSSFFKYALSKGLLIQVSLEFVEQEGSLIKDKYSVDEFIQQFKTPESLFRRVQELAIENKFSFEQSEVDQSKSFLNTYLKALIARDIWSTEVFFRVFNQSDPILLKALEILESNKYNEILKSSLN